MTSTLCGCIAVNTPIFQTLWEEPIKLHVQLSTILPSQFLIFSIFLQKRPEILSSSKISFWNNCCCWCCCCCCCYCCCSTLQLCCCDGFLWAEASQVINVCFTWFCQITAHPSASSDEKLKLENEGKKYLTNTTSCLAFLLGHSLMLCSLPQPWSRLIQTLTLLPLRRRLPRGEPSDLDGSMVLSPATALSKTLLPAERPLRYSRGYILSCTVAYRLATDTKNGLAEDGPSLFISTLS